MWVDRILRNAGDSPLPGPGQAIDWLDVEWDHGGRAIKGTSRGGRDVRGLLPRGRARHGDVLADDAGLLLVVTVPPCDVFVVRPPSAAALARAALELGNLHWPTSVGEYELVCPADGSVAEVFTAMNVPWTPERRRFEPTPVLSSSQVELSHGFAVTRATCNTAQGRESQPVPSGPLAPVRGEEG